MLLLLFYKLYDNIYLLLTFRLMRSDILASAVLCEIEEVVKEAKNKFDEWMYENKRVPPNLREVIYLAGNSNTLFLFYRKSCTYLTFFNRS